mgnify:CR=1 FL=1
MICRPVRKAGSSPAAMRRRSVWTLMPSMSAAVASEMKAPGLVLLMMEMFSPSR